MAFIMLLQKFQRKSELIEFMYKINYIYFTFFIQLVAISSLWPPN